jgi:predicted RNA methylase
MLQSKGLNRNTIDKYYTKKSAVELCIELFQQYITITDNDIIIEPSAGNGSFINNIKLLAKNYKFYDIEPDNAEIIKQDYLQLDTDNFKQYDNIHVVGNPPFGRQSSTAIKFIKKSCEFSNTISFILPKSFKKESIKRHYPLEFHLLVELDIPHNSFMVDDKEHDVPCVFQIWQRQINKREKPVILCPDNFTFVLRDENPDLSVRRVGVNAGVVSDTIDNKSIQSHYFIKLIEKNIDDNLIDKLNKIKFISAGYTVGPKSISKQELIKEFNSIL